MAGAPQVPKHDWSLPTRPGLEIEDVSEVGNIPHRLGFFFFCYSLGRQRQSSRTSCIGHLRDEGLPLLGIQPVERAVPKLLNCASHWASSRKNAGDEKFWIFHFSKSCVEASLWAKSVLKFYRTKRTPDKKQVKHRG